MITGMPRIAIAVKDFDAAMATFRDKLGMPVYDMSDESMEWWGAKVAMCAPATGSNIEIMAPGDPGEPLSQSVQRFMDRRGEGQFALMLEAADPDAEAELLLQRGLNALPRMQGAGGRDIHPNSTHGVLIRVYPTNSVVKLFPDQVKQVDSLPITGIQRVVVAVQDLEEAATTYGVKFAMPVAAPVADSDRGVRTVVCTPPSGGLIELTAVADASRAYAAGIAEFLAVRGEGMYALVLRCDDLRQQARALADQGIPSSPVPGLPAAVELDRSTMNGARFWLEC